MQTDAGGSGSHRDPSCLLLSRGLGASFTLLGDQEPGWGVIRELPSPALPHKVLKAEDALRYCSAYRRHLPRGISQILNLVGMGSTCPFGGMGAVPQETDTVLPTIPAA